MLQGRNTKLYYTCTKEFIEQAEKQKKPFFFMANSDDPHRPFHGSSQEKNKWQPEMIAQFSTPSRIYSEQEVADAIPGFLPDLGSVRRDLAQYYSSVRRADDTPGEILRALEETGVASDTIVIFLPDNGMAFPSAKWNVYQQSTKIPFIVRWPAQLL